MAIPGGFFGRFFGRTISDAAGYGIGGAIQGPLEPLLRELENVNWSGAVKQGIAKPLDPGATADSVAEDEALEQWAKDQAAQAGFSPEQTDVLVRTALNAPAVALLLEAWRRNLISDADFTHGLRKARLEQRWDKALRALKDRLLAPADLANARQQGYIGEGRQKSESELQGVDNERAELLFLLSGLPPGVETGLEMLRRKIITPAEFAVLVREGHTKTKYTDELLALRNRVLSAAEYATLRLKGWLTKGEAEAGGALTGYDADAMELLFLARGRPASPVQMFNAIARKAPGPYGGVTGWDDFDKAIQQSDIRPEYAQTLRGIYHAYPSLFQLRRAVQEGSISRARALEILHIERYEDRDAVALVDSWTGPSTTGVKELTASTALAEYEGGFIDQAALVSQLRALGFSANAAGLYAELGDARRVKSARDATLTTIRQRYVSHQLSTDEMRAQLDKTGVSDEAKARLVVEWDNAREATRVQLTAAQVKKAYAKNQITRAEAEDLLAARGWRALDLQRYLDQ